jgi:hypothetical protein
MVANEEGRTFGAGGGGEAADPAAANNIRFGALAAVGHQVTEWCVCAG